MLTKEVSIEKKHGQQGRGGGVVGGMVGGMVCNFAGHAEGLGARLDVISEKLKIKNV